MRYCKYILSIAFVLQNISTTSAQQPNPIKSMVLLRNDHLTTKVDNLIRIVAQQAEPVSVNQLSATMQVYDAEKKPIEIVERNGGFFIHPDTVGIVELHISIGDTIETKIMNVHPLEAVGRLGGRFGCNMDKKIGLAEFKAQSGIAAIIEYGDWDAKCNVLGYQMLRISTNNRIERAINRGGKFDDAAMTIISHTESGDLFIFRKIKYKCPGASSPQRLEDMIFEIE